MDILVATYNMSNVGGAQNYTYAIITELLRLGHNVEYFTFKKGIVSEKTEKLGVKFLSKNRYDLIIANHRPVIWQLFQYGYTVQTCHGVLKYEMPSWCADYHVCVSAYQKEFFAEKGIECELIVNGIDCSRFYPEMPVNKKLTTVLSLCHSKGANKLIASCCKELNLTFKTFDKITNNVWDIEKEINKADLVIGVGRSLYDAMACGRPVISYDTRFKERSFEGDGYLDKNNIYESLVYNCCGGSARRFFTQEDLTGELLKYNADDGLFMREFAVKELNIRKAVEKYLAIPAGNSNIRKRDAKAIHLYNEMTTEIFELKKTITAMKSSRSWRVTMPLRKIAGVLRKFKK